MVNGFLRCLTEIKVSNDFLYSFDILGPYKRIFMPLQLKETQYPQGGSKLFKKEYFFLKHKLKLQI